jgi:hypothetical protein
MTDETIPALDVLAVFAPLADDLAPFLKRIRSRLAEIQPLPDVDGHDIADCTALRAEGEAISATAGIEGLSFTIATIADTAGERAGWAVALLQRSWSDLPGWGTR